MLRDNRGIRVRTVRKWNASEALKEAESKLEHQDIVGTVAQGRLGLGCLKRASWKSASTKERRGLVQTETRRKKEEEKRLAEQWLCPKRAARRIGKEPEVESN
jgi:hypothetical protein